VSPVRLKWCEDCRYWSATQRKVVAGYPQAMCLSKHSDYRGRYTDRYGHCAAHEPGTPVDIPTTIEEGPP